MTRLILARLLLSLTLLAPLVVAGTPVLAVEPDEILADPALESRARELSKDLRCLVCRNENIDESNADLARDLRLLLRERLVAGDSDDAAMDFIVERYGEYVLLSPRATGANWLLYAAGPLMLVLALVLAGGYIRNRSRTPSEEDPGAVVLSAQERAQLDRILKD
ncbi:cytochrome c-type biogenesis protein [Phaeobacter porticola]|uniref:Cytochrome c-type biogenesis protein n=1 Tax=Phaeobacter porticola TaxID=1844006 RepID=A0A1L3I4S0_9RHOB|nr:cytochrome c-type biogenesis protein [Phaeobacter porticola]APG47123.1 cytochrome c-type biogenesis protein Ccl [Phaeobacter porticola]